MQCGFKQIIPCHLVAPVTAGAADIRQDCIRLYMTACGFTALYQAQTHTQLMLRLKLQLSFCRRLSLLDSPPCRFWRTSPPVHVSNVVSGRPADRQLLMLDRIAAQQLAGMLLTCRSRVLEECFLAMCVSVGVGDANASTRVMGLVNAICHNRMSACVLQGGICLGFRGSRQGDAGEKNGTAAGPLGQHPELQAGPGSSAKGAQKADFGSGWLGIVRSPPAGPLGNMFSFLSAMQKVLHFSSYRS